MLFACFFHVFCDRLTIFSHLSFQLKKKKCFLVSILIFYMQYWIWGEKFCFNWDKKKHFSIKKKSFIENEKIIQTFA